MGGEGGPVAGISQKPLGGTQGTCRGQGGDAMSSQEVQSRSPTLTTQHQWVSADGQKSLCANLLEWDWDPRLLPDPPEGAEFP